MVSAPQNMSCRNQSGYSISAHALEPNRADTESRNRKINVRLPQTGLFTKTKGMEK
jgi:hypothetical protein